MRALKVLVVVMGVLIVGGTVTLAMLLVQRVGGAGGGTRWEAALDQPEGTRIAGVAATESGIGVLVTRPDGDRVLVVEPKRGRVVGEIRPGR
ncbi:DUF6476 family protein [Paracraurococcus lichenis]|uniref:DUF6476 family protein n=1 Tax=Paracraurococcus lichenis TaxID=3064888 RepID=A0ABT9DZR8_9PROT|nr:DUF6476 family protein [Paracraurococcus sp. LOR1-02]MDO9709379.1 DUF6476 family protein [Paracraurococcus sp. LOR1-02]